MVDIFDPKNCQVCGEQFEHGELVTRVERVYSVGFRISPPELTEKGTLIHVACAGDRS